MGRASQIPALSFCFNWNCYTSNKAAFVDLKWTFKSFFLFFFMWHISHIRFHSLQLLTWFFFSLPPLLHFLFLLCSCVSVDFGCFAVITGLRKRVEASNGVVYAVITRGIYLCFSQCASGEKNKQTALTLLAAVKCTTLGKPHCLMHPSLRPLTLHVLAGLRAWCTCTFLSLSLSLALYLLSY